MIRVFGVLLALVGLILVGMHEDKPRPRRNQPRPRRNRLMIGVALMVVGAILALAGTQIALQLGWVRP